MSAALALLPRLRAAGADALLRDGKPVLKRVSCVSQDLLAEVKARRDDLLAELADGDAPFIDDPIERAAIQAEADGKPVQRLRSRYVGDNEPQPGDYCGCCHSSLWWTEAEEPKGWRCSRCHPPANLQAGHFRVVAT